MIRRLGLLWLWGIINFAAGSVATAILGFVIFTAIYHAGVCK